MSADRSAPGHGWRRRLARGEVRLFSFAPFKYRRDPVVGLAFRYDRALVERLKAVLRTARAAVPQAHPHRAVTVAGGWLPQYGVWFCEPPALPAVLKALAVAGYRARWVTAPPWDVDPGPGAGAGAGQERHQAGGAGEPVPDARPAPDPGPPPSPDRDHTPAPGLTPTQGPDSDSDAAPIPRPDPSHVPDPTPWPDDWAGRGAWAWRAVPPDDWGPTDSELADGSPVYRVLCPCGATPLVDGDGACPRCRRRYRINTVEVVERWEPD